MFTETGATKSLTSAGNDADERLLRNALPNASQVPGGKTPAAVRLIAASPKVSAGRVLGALGAIGSVTAPTLFTAPIELVLFRFTWLPQHGRLLLEKHWLGLLVDLEVHVRRAEVVGALPRQIQEVPAIGATDELGRLVEAREVALLRRDRAAHHRDVGVVLLGALAERVVPAAAGQVDALDEALHGRPVGVHGRIGHEIAVTALKGAGGQRRRTRLSSAIRGEVTPGRAIREARSRDSEGDGEGGGSGQRAPRSPGQKKPMRATARRRHAAAVRARCAHILPSLGDIPSDEADRRGRNRPNCSCGVGA